LIDFNLHHITCQSKIPGTPEAITLPPADKSQWVQVHSISVSSRELIDKDSPHSVTIAYSSRTRADRPIRG
jgi:hypothetical protein